MFFSKSFYLAYYTKNINKKILTYNQEWVEKENSTITPDFNIQDLFSCVEGIPFSFIDLFNGYVIAFLIGLNAIHITRERHSGSKKLQLLQGTHFITYWISNYIFDFFVNIISIATILITLSVIASVNDDSEAYVLLGTTHINAFYLFVFMVIGSFSWSTFAYLWSFLFKSDIAAFVVIYLVLAGVATIDMVMGYLFLLYDSEKWTRPFAESFRTAFTVLFPNIPVKRALYNLKIQHIESCVRYVTKRAEVSTFDWATPGIGSILTYNVIFLIFGIGLLFFIEIFGASMKHSITQLFIRKKTGAIEQLEDDVDAEVNRIYSEPIRGLVGKEPIVVKNLYKKYKVKGKEVVAVNNLSFGVASGECFGYIQHLKRFNYYNFSIVLCC